MHTSVYALKCACMCMQVFMCVRLHVCVCVWVCARAHAHVFGEEGMEQGEVVSMCTCIRLHT